MWLFKFFLVKNHLLHHQAVLHYTLPPLPLHLLLIISILLLLLLILLLLLLFKEVWKASRQGPVGQALASSSPRFQNIDRFKIIHKLQNSDGYHKTLTFRSL